MQAVTIHRAADRHERLHERVYAETFVRTVPAGELAGVLAAATRDLPLPCGRWLVEVDWPHEARTAAS